MQRSLRSLEGYLLIDHRNSPGVSPALAAANGLQDHAPTPGAGACFESATVTCAHCHRVVILNPDRSRPRGYCAKCHHYVCDNPACNRDCVPFNAVLDALQAAAFKAEQAQKSTIWLPPSR